MSLCYLFLFFVVSGMIRIGGVLLRVLWYGSLDVHVYPTIRD